MKVGELKKMLEGVDDNLPVVIQCEYGYGCSMVVTDVDCKKTEIVLDPELDEEVPVFSLGGEENQDLSSN